ncbi:high-affinity nicotinic acid transporter [Trichoderma austrokoningii]
MFIHSRHHVGLIELVIDETSPSRIESDNSEARENATDDAAKRARRKVDTRLLLWYSFVYLIMKIHVGNITNTAIMNLEDGHDIRTQLGHLSSQQWAWVLSIFYYPYLFFEPVATLALKRFNPNIWMCRIMITWGIVSMCQAATKNYAGILACRFFLGLAEAGFYPGAIYHFSFWYPPERLPLRVSFFFASGMFSGTISGLLAYGISFMDGAGGLAGWRWMFILEGLPIIFCGIYTYFYLPNYPQIATFLTSDEKRALLTNLPEDSPTMRGSTWDWNQVKDMLRNPTFVPFLVIWAAHGIGGYGITFILPSVVYELGISNTAIAQLMTMPPYTLVFIILMSIAYLIHTKRVSAWVAALGVELLQIICYILLITVKAPIAKYVFILVGVAGTHSLFPVLWSERIRNTRGTTAAGMAIGMTNAAAQLQGIGGPQIYQLKFGPAYHTSYFCSIGLLSLSLISIAGCWFLVSKADRKRKLADSTEVQDEKLVDE